MILATLPRVVLVDDNPVVLDVVSDLLSEHFDVVGRFNDGVLVAEESAALGADLLILDIGLPTVNGFEVAKQLSRLEHPPEIIFLTLYDEPEFIRAAFDAGASGYVLKSRLNLDLEEAIAAVRGGGQFISIHGVPDC